MEPFTILPSGVLKRALRGDCSDYTDRRWVRVATLCVGPRGLVAVDPMYWRPRVDDCFDVSLPARTESADVWLERWSGRGRRARFAAVRLVVAPGTVRTRRIVDSMAVDSLRVLVAGRDGIDASWRVGGQKSRSNIAAFGEDARRAEVVLRDAGFALRQESGMVFFARALTDAAIERANAALEAADVEQRVNVCRHHTVAQLEAAYRAGRPTVLRARGKPYAVVFDCGWGNGIYPWHRLGDGGRKLLGYECRFDP